MGVALLGLELVAHIEASLGLAVHRALMPRRFDERALDALLISLAPNRFRPRRLSLAAAARTIRRAEYVLSRTPKLPDTCLYRALARYAVLLRAGFPTTFLMGIPRSGDAGPGHAWVEVFGQPFAEARSVADLAITFRYPPSASDHSDRA